MRKYLSLLVFTALLCVKGYAQQPVYLQASQPIDKRVADLIGRLTVEEKVAQMKYNSPAIPRLNIPEYNWWNEALHGVGRSGVATVFPQAIGLAATFDDSLAQAEASVISTEARAMYNISAAKGNRNMYAGLTFWTPNINIFRDPRWGRGQETYGEDPYLTARMGVAFVNGLQGNDARYLKVAACAKHFAVHSGPERLRHGFNAKATLHDLFDTYLPAFKALVNAKVEAVMCAYNRTNEEPCCANTFLLQDVLRKQWGFKGHVVSDCWALADFYKGHKVVADAKEAAALALHKGVNLNCGSVYDEGLLPALKAGLVTEKEIDSTLATLLRTKFRLGMFDAPAQNPYSTLSEKDINTTASRTLARTVAQRSIVLLKNNGILPLQDNLKKYFITGPNVANIDALIGNYYGINNNMVTFYEGIATAVQPGSQVQYRPGILLDRDNVNPIDWTTSEASNSDATIVVLGINGLLEGEEGDAIASPSFGDRLDYNLPKNQVDFLKKMKQGNSKPVIAVITGGSPMNLADIHDIADAVVLVWYPGEEGGNALADVLFGKVSPSGKLPLSFPKSLDQLPAYEDYSMKGRTYRYNVNEPMYPFGFGLSYSKFTYTNLVLSKNTVSKNETAEAAVTLTNTGKYDADEVVQIYLTHLEGQEDKPLYALKGFKRVRLKAGASTVVKFSIKSDMLTLINEDGVAVTTAGKIKISIGGSLPGKRSQELGAATGAEVILEVK